MDDQTLFEQLLQADGEEKVEAILKRAELGLDNEAVWPPLGGMENNFSTVGNQQSDPTAAMVEKIINGIDAVLMAECFKRDIDPEGARTPTTMAEAVEQFFSVRGGRLADLDAKSQTALAKRINVVAVGEKKTPCYLIIDDGEGQTPDSFPDTFLSLNKSNKLRIPFVQGKFNSGGTGVLQFCGEHNMQLIVSRRHPNAPVRSKDASRDLWGFTIVQRMKPTAGRKNSMYVYLAPGGAVPRFRADKINVLPEDRSTVLPPAPYKAGLAYGTCVKLYNFRWKAQSIATTEARYELERFLHSPCLPFRLTETRDYRANYFSTTIAGVWAAIGAGTDEDSKVEAGFPAFADLDLQGVGHLPYRIAVFKESVRHRHVPHGVFFTVNGQVHGGLPADFVTRRLKFDYLRDNLLVSIDCTAMDSTVREDFFMASRDRLRRNDVYDEIVERLKEELRDHPGLRELNAARRKKAIEQAVSDENETINLFNELLRADPLLASLFATGDRLVTSTGPGQSPPFVGKKFPTYFRLSKNPRDGLVKRCPVNWHSRVEFETDAANDYFKRTDSPGSITTEPPNLIEHSQLWNGRFMAHLRVPWNAKPGDRIDVTVTIEDVQSQARGQPFVSKLVLVAEPEQDPRPSGSNGGPSTRSPQQKSTTRAPSLAIPEIHEFKKDPNVALEVKHRPEGGHDFFVNIENTYLLTELTRAKEEDQPLVKFWFKYGLALCALGMLQEQGSRAESKKTNDATGAGMKANGKRREAKAETEGDGKNDAEDILQRVNTACTGLARVIIPIIRALYRGPPGSPE